GRRARGKHRAQPARNLQASARPARRRTGGGADRGPAAHLRARRPSARRAGRLARAVPAQVGAEPRRPRAASGPQAVPDPQGALTMYGAYDTIENRPALRFERRLSHPVDVVWRAITESDELVHWFPSRVEVDDLHPGAEMTFRFEEMPLEGMPLTI